MITNEQGTYDTNYKYKYKYKYILNNIGTGEKLWRCEVCGVDVNRMFFQIELLKQAGESKWTSHGCQNQLGHRGCLIETQKGDANDRMER